MLTVERLKELLHYDPETGEFTRLVARSGPRGKVGSVVGTPDDEGYLRIAIDGQRYKAHRLAVLYITGNWPAEVVDHLDGDPTNNSWRNLHCCSHKENMRRQRLRTDNTSGVKGVGFCKRHGKWLAYIKVDGVNHELGFFEDRESAIAARKAAEDELGYFLTTSPRFQYQKKLANTSEQ